MFTPKQQNQLLNLGIEEAQIEQQIEYFKNGFKYVNLAKPATVGDGIITPSESDLSNWIKTFDENSPNSNITKFVPASGAASRMFKSILEYLKRDDKNSDISKFPEAHDVIKNIEKFAFTNELQNAAVSKNIDLRKALHQGDFDTVLGLIVNDNGLNYAALPKGLLSFHYYKDEIRTPVDEHIAEGLQYATGKNKLKVHFTISEEHESHFKKEFDKVLSKFSKNNENKIELGYSFQKASTDTIAVDMNNNPLTDSEGKFIFRPGGHGALLENLNDLDSDIIFIKNIDNVVPDHLKPITTKYKKALAGLLITIRQNINEYLSYLEWHDNYTDKKRQLIAAFLENYLQIKVPKDLPNQVFAEYIKSKLDKPIRICGMVKNTGEPGGGPFWVTNMKGDNSLQIIESSQVDMRNEKQKQIFTSATHFNPVDIVCSTKDYTGHKFNLLRYRDPNTGFISEKTLGGKKIKALELPGLWNGSMANWITIFVEVPVETFNPVKTINDLLRKEHQSAF